MSLPWKYSPHKNSLERFKLLECTSKDTIMQNKNSSHRMTLLYLNQNAKNNLYFVKNLANPCNIVLSRSKQLSTQTLMIIGDQSHKIDDLIKSPITPD